MKLLSEFIDPSQVEQIMKNAKRLGREDVYREALKRLCELEGLSHNDPLTRDFFATLRAYEELLTQKNGRTTKASRTRQKLTRHTVVECLEDWAIGKNETQGFSLLTTNGLTELTGEYLVIKYATRFSERAVASAKARLSGVMLRDELEQILASSSLSLM